MSTCFDKTGLTPDQAVNEVLRLRAINAELLKTLEITLDDLAWCSKNNGECLGDFPKLLERVKAHVRHARAILARAKRMPGWVRGRA